MGAAVIGVIGVATLAQPHDRRELPLAALPLGFALHQGTEGFVWLGLDEHVPEATGQVAMYAYLAYAWVLLPLLVPLAVMLAEPLRSRRRVLGVFTALGALVAGHLAISMTTNHLSARIAGHTIQYGGAGANADFFTVLYVLATCGAFLLSSHRRVVWFGVANLAAVFVLVWIQSEGLTSLWCVWGALASVLIYLHFVERRRVADPIAAGRARVRRS